jgi:hypothetical protein
MVFLGGVILGMALHLVEDLCTRKGIWPFFPINPGTIAGSIRPCDRTDPRIAQYHLQYCMILLVLTGLKSQGLLPQALFLLISILGISVCLGMMVVLSEVSVSSENTGNGSTPAPASVTH